MIYSSTKGDNIIRYLSLHDNAFLRYFSGHKSRVTQLEMSPINDIFISGAPCDSLRIWDLRVAECQGVMECPIVTPLIAIDPQGMVFAVALGSRYIRLYDLGDYEKGPFAVFEIEDPLRPHVQWCGIKFSPDGKDLLVSTKESVHYLINSFEGTFRQTFVVPDARHHGVPFEASFSPDGLYILAGSPDKKIYCWKRETGKQVACFEGHSGMPALLRFNPTKMMFASACDNLAFWIPEL